MWKKMLSELVPYISIEDGGKNQLFWKKQNMSLRLVKYQVEGQPGALKTPGFR